MRAIVIVVALAAGVVALAAPSMGAGRRSDAGHNVQVLDSGRQWINILPAPRMTSVPDAGMSVCGPRQQTVTVPCVNGNDPGWFCGRVNGKWQWLQLCLEAGKTIK